ncbi:hypothetical protein DSO57_1007730 [Entomophthora muscae]|uniref:Uncharacterized protein n=1 Tax=Entomophthora muscae TaxID=34485 RepID=A0ACC2TIA0_9FUNG|nr:hypothetical protein DSO57_1007730 [Entomophthora muscae]
MLSNTADGYAYQMEIKGMLEEWALQQAVNTVVMSAEMEQCEWPAKEITAACPNWRQPKALDSSF